MEDTNLFGHVMTTHYVTSSVPDLNPEPTIYQYIEGKKIMLVTEISP